MKSSAQKSSQQSTPKLRIAHPEDLPTNIDVYLGYIGILLVAVANDGRIETELVEYLQRNSLLLQKSLVFLSRGFILDFLLVKLILSALLLLLLLRPQVISILLFGCNIDGGQPLVHFIVGWEVEKHSIFRYPGSSFTKFSVLWSDPNTKHISEGKRPTVIENVLALSLDKTSIVHTHTRSADALFTPFKFLSTDNWNKANLHWAVGLCYFDFKISCILLSTVIKNCGLLGALELHLKDLAGKLLLGCNNDSIFIEAGLQFGVAQIIIFGEAQVWLVRKIFWRVVVLLTCLMSFVENDDNSDNNRNNNENNAQLNEDSSGHPEKIATGIRCWRSGVNFRSRIYGF